MGCTCRTRYSLDSGWIVRERRVFRDDVLASESVLGARLTSGS